MEAPRKPKGDAPVVENQAEVVPIPELPYVKRFKPPLRFLSVEGRRAQ